MLTVFSSSHFILLGVYFAVSSIGASYDWLIENKDRLSPVDRAYLLALPNQSFTMAQAMRIGVIYAQTLVNDAKAVKQVISDEITGPDVKSSSKDLVDLSNGEFRVTTEYNEETRFRMSNLKGSKWLPHERQWSAPFNGQTVIELKDLIRRGHLNASSQALSKMSDILASEAANRRAGKATECSFKLSPGFGSPDYSPYPYQLAGIQAAIGFGNPYFGDPMGLGKTIQMLGWVHETKALPLFIVTKPTLMLNIEEECRKAFPNAVISVCNSKSTLQKSDIIITSYNLLSAGWANKKKTEVKLTPLAQQIEAHGYKTMACDEAHCIKTSNSPSQRSIACIQMSETATQKALISGSPILNRNLELINPLKFLGVLDKLGGEWHFKKRYCGARQVHIAGRLVWDFTSNTNNGELFERLSSMCLIRRKKKEVLPELPDKVVVDISTELTNMGEYRKVKANVLKYYSDLKLQEQEFIHSIRGLSGIEREIAIEKERKKIEVKARLNKVLIEFGILRQITSQGKISAIVDKVSDIIDEGGKVIVFAWYKATQYALKEALAPYNPLTIMAADTLEERHASMHAFQSGPRDQPLIASINVAAEGLNLTAADHVLFAETGMVPTIMEQCEDRAWRLGQKRDVTAHYMWAKGTTDDAIRRMLKDKTKTFDETINGVNQTLSEAQEILKCLEYLEKQFES